MNEENKMNENSKKNAITIDGTEYNWDNISDFAKEKIKSIQFTDVEILQLKNKLSISTTARNGYLNALQKEILTRE